MAHSGLTKISPIVSVIFHILGGKVLLVWSTQPAVFMFMELFCPFPGYQQLCLIQGLSFIFPPVFSEISDLVHVNSNQGQILYTLRSENSDKYMSNSVTVKINNSWVSKMKFCIVIQRSVTFHFCAWQWIWPVIDNPMNEIEADVNMFSTGMVLMSLG